MHTANFGKCLPDIPFYIFVYHAQYYIGTFYTSNTAKAGRVLCCSKHSHCINKLWLYAVSLSPNGPKGTTVDCKNVGTSVCTQTNVQTCQQEVK